MSDPIPNVKVVTIVLTYIAQLNIFRITMLIFPFSPKKAGRDPSCLQKRDSLGENYMQLCKTKMCAARRGSDPTDLVYAAESSLHWAGG